MTVTNNANLTRREIISKLCKLLLNHDDFAKADRIPIKMRPRHNSPIRCCTFRDRAVIKYKIMAMLGFDTEYEEDELKSISAYFKEALKGDTKGSDILSVVDEACSACNRNNYIVTNMCRGCDGRACMFNCPKDAIQFVDNRAHIDQNKCVSCGICEKVCPFHAIIYSPVPCEEACPVNAIEKDAHGKEKINMDKCILCGKCMEACPYGAIVEKTHLFDVVLDVQQEKEVIAIIAPAIAGQFREGMGKIAGSLRKLGFSDVIEVAYGADITSRTEAAEFKEKVEEGHSMTTSCCPAYVNLIEKHHPEFKEYVSTTKSPMEYTAQFLREQKPDAKLVFIGPCVGKKSEASKSEFVDYVLNFEEFGSWLVAAGIEIADCSEMPMNYEISPQARKYASAGGVSSAVAEELKGVEFDNVQFDGIDKTFIRKLKQTLKSKTPTLVEVMSCENGCIGGCSNIANPKLALRQINKFADGFAGKKKELINK